MAFSMFMRRSGCLNKAFSQQISRLATQPVLMSSLNKSSLPAVTLGLSQRKIPVFDSVRPIQTTSPRMSEKAHDHARLWVIEKGVTALMVPLIPAALIMPSKILDSALAILITAHSFWGLEAIAVDYVRASMFGSVIPKIAIGLVYAISIATLGGLFYIISHDVGIANTIRNFWAIRSEKS